MAPSGVNDTIREMMARLKRAIFATVKANATVTAGDNAAMGYSSDNGLELIGQGTTNDVVLMNDLKEIVARIPTGTDDVVFTDNITVDGLIFDDDTMRDYDTGTFTPVFADAASGGNASPTSLTGRYVRSGKSVTCWIDGNNIDTSGLTAGNDAYIRGLPFTEESTGNVDPIGAVALSSVTFSGFVSFRLDTGQTYGRFAECVSGAPLDFLTVGEFSDDAADLWITITYEVD